MVSPHVIMISPNVLNIPRCTHDIPRCTHGIPPMYWTPPDVLNIPRSTEHTLYRVITARDYSHCKQLQFPDYPLFNPTRNSFSNSKTHSSKTSGQNGTCKSGNHYCFEWQRFNPIRPGGAQRPGWPNSQLTIRILLLYDAETWWLLVFILKAHSDQILAKLINQGGCCCSFIIETSQNFENEKIFLCLKIVEIDMGGQFWVEKNDSGHKGSFFKVKPVFRG